jgi:GRIM-19 protein
MLAVGLVMGYGWYKLIPGLRERMEYQREKAWARIHLTPVMQAEEDRDQVRRYYADLAREKELLGTESSAYNSDRYVCVPYILEDAVGGAGWVGRMGESCEREHCAEGKELRMHLWERKLTTEINADS